MATGAPGICEGQEPVEVEKPGRVSRRHLGRTSISQELWPAKNATARLPNCVFQVCRGGSPLADMLGTQRVSLAQPISA